MLGTLHKRFVSAFSQVMLYKSSRSRWRAAGCGYAILVNPQFVAKYPWIIMKLWLVNNHEYWWTHHLNIFLSLLVKMIKIPVTMTKPSLLVLPRNPGRWCARNESCEPEGWAQGEGTKTTTPFEHITDLVSFSMGHNCISRRKTCHIIHLVWDIPFNIQLTSIFIEFIPLANSSFVCCICIINCARQLLYYKCRFHCAGTVIPLWMPSGYRDCRWHPTIGNASPRIVFFHLQSCQHLGHISHIIFPSMTSRYSSSRDCAIYRKSCWHIPTI